MNIKILGSHNRFKILGSHNRLSSRSANLMIKENASNAKLPHVYQFRSIAVYFLGGSSSWNSNDLMVNHILKFEKQRSKRIKVLDWYPIL